MGILNNLEKTLERTVNGVFSKAFKAEFEPVELASALRENMDKETINLSKNRILAPNLFSVTLNTKDYEKAKNWGTPFVKELCGILVSHAKSQNYFLSDSVRITFSINENIKTGKFEITTKTANKSELNLTPQISNFEPQTTNIYQNVTNNVQTSLPTFEKVFLNIEGNKYSLEKEITVIGRTKEADIVINDTGISRKHLEIRKSNNKIFATDLNSTNGSFVEGRKIVTPIALQNKTTIRIGHTDIIVQSASQYNES